MHPLHRTMRLNLSGLPPMVGRGGAGSARGPVRPSLDTPATDSQVSRSPGLGGSPALPDLTSRHNHARDRNMSQRCKILVSQFRLAPPSETKLATLLSGHENTGIHLGASVGPKLRRNG